MQSIIKLLPALLRLSQNNDEMCESAVFAAWRATVGEALARVTRPLHLTRKTLAVAVIDDTWKKQLGQMSGQILFKLNTILGSALVTGLEFQIDPETALASEKTPPLLPAPEILLDDVLMESAARIQDPDLRARFLKTAGKYLSARQRKSGSGE
jgi:hypothetical protein